MPGTNEHLSIDVYRILRLNPGASAREIKINYNRLGLRFHPDKIVGRNPTKSEELAWKDINMANRILSDDREKREWDNYNSMTDNNFECWATGNCAPGWSERMNITREVPNHFSNISMRWFCSAEHAAAYETEQGYTAETHGYVLNRVPPPPPPPSTIMRRCPVCNLDRLFGDYGIGWAQYSLFGPNSELCCTEYCLDNYLRGKGINATKCNYRHCRKIKREGDAAGWVRDPAHRENIYCRGEHLVQEITSGDFADSSGLDETTGNDPFDGDRKAAIATITDTLNQDPPIVVTELESTNQNWRIEIQNAPNSGAIGVIKDRVLADISQKRAAKGGNSVLDDRKKVAITKIKGELAQDPVVQNSELESTNQGWENAIQTAANETIVNQIETQVLNDIQTKRSAKDPLAKLQSAAINQILDELVSQEPSVDESEITNRNWEGDIISAKSESEINRILQETLAEIRKKRASQQETDLLSNLLLQAKAPQNWDNYQNLENILQQIKKLRSSNIYQTKISEIQAIEDRLHELDPNQYQETVEKSLDQQLKNNNLTEGDLDHETKQAMVEAKQDPTSKTKKKEAEDKIAVCGARKELTAILNKADRVQGDPTKKNELITQILDFLVKNSFTLQAYNERRTAVDHLLNKLIQGDSSNQQNPEFPWLKVLGISAAIFFPLVLISFLVLKTRQSGRGKKK